MQATRLLERWIRAISIILWDGRLITIRVESRHVRREAERKRAA